jgi:capsular polysaccharide transport system permease protein
MSNTETQTPPHMRVIDLQPLESQGELAPIEDPRFLVEDRPSFLRRWAAFIVLVFVPAFISGVYLAFLASNQYVSEASYFVRASADTGGSISLMAPSGGFTRSAEDTYALNEYLRSRDMVSLLVKEDGLREILSRPEGDFLTRYPNFYSRNTFESMYEHFRRIATVSVDGTSGISTLEVRTFRPEDSQRLAEAMLRHGEGIINQLNKRARDDAVKVALAEVQSAEKRLQESQNRVTEFRNTELILDPLKQSEAALGNVAKLAAEISKQQAQLSQIMSMAPNSPQAAPVRESIKALQRQLDLQRQEIAGGDKSLSTKISAYDQIALERELATKSLASAHVSLETARREGQKQQLYLETITSPHLPDYSTFPNRTMLFALILGGCLCVFWILNSIIGVLREHEA